MYNGLAFFKTASALAGHAAQRQAVIARNIANADTPGYLARDLPPFAEIHRALDVGRRSGVMDLAATRPGHRSQSDWTRSMQFDAQVLPGDASPNGNTVSLETEMIKATSVKQTHDLALATYRGGLDLLRSALGRGR